MRNPIGSIHRDAVLAARREGRDPRPALLRLLVARHLAAPMPSKIEQARFATLAIRLFDAVDLATARRAVAELATSGKTPLALALHLARGPIATAGPILRFSPALDEATLLSLAASSSPAHVAAISARREVSSRLAKSLASALHEARDNPAKNDRVNDNRVEDHPAKDGPSLAVPTPGDAAIVAAPAGAPVPNDPAPAILRDVPETVGPSMPQPSAAPPAVEVVAIEVSAAAASETPALEAHALEAPAVEAPAAEAPAVESPAAEAPAEPATADPRTGWIPAAGDAFFVATAEQRGALFDRLGTFPPLPLGARIPPASVSMLDRLEQAALRHQPAVFATLLEKALGVDERIARSIVSDTDGEAVIVACRAIGMPFETVARVLFFLNPEIGQSVARVFGLAHLFEALPEASAQHLVATWRGTGRRAGARGEEAAPSMRSFAQPRRSGASTAGEQSERRRG